MSPHIRSQALNLAYRVPIERSSDMGSWEHHHGSWWTRKNELRSILHVSRASVKGCGGGREIRETAGRLPSQVPNKPRSAVCVAGVLKNYWRS